MVTEAKKRANKKYNQKHYKTIAFCTNIETADLFELYCKTQNKTKNKILNEFVEKCIKEVEKDEK